jgi:hypothetical protein
MALSGRLRLGTLPKMLHHPQPRQVHRAGKFPITATPDVGSFNPFLGGGGPRGIQLAAKFTF